jgi:hypothetical protein
MRLNDVLADPEAYEWSDTLFLPRHGSWTPDSTAMVLPTDDLAPGEEEPAEARDAGLKWALGIQQVQDLVAGVPNTREDRFAAFIYYHDRDAAIPNDQLEEWKARLRDRLR